jgi:hypothetical protein
MLPQARHDRLLVQQVGDELVVYDQEWHRAHRLNRSAAVIWSHCDGRTSAAELAELLTRELNLPVDERVVRLALDQLEQARLLQERSAQPADIVGIPRRHVIRRLELTAGLAFCVPMVESIVAPTPPMAQNNGGGGDCAGFDQPCSLIPGDEFPPCCDPFQCEFVFGEFKCVLLLPCTPTGNACLTDVECCSHKCSGRICISNGGGGGGTGTFCSECPGIMGCSSNADCQALGCGDCLGIA